MATFEFLRCHVEKSTQNPCINGTPYHIGIVTHRKAKGYQMKIDKNIPMPKRIGVRGNGKYPWQEMEVGDSIHFENVTGGSNSKEAVAARSWACRYGNGKRFSCRAVDGGLRIWRIA